MYLDSAILVKLVVREPDSDFYASVVDGQRNVFSSELAVVECRSALARKRQHGELGVRQYDGAWQRLQDFWADGGGLQLRPIALSVLQEAGDIIERCAGRVPLRTLDAIHLATCLRIRAAPLVTNDTVMRAAAGVLGVPLGPLPDHGIGQ